MSAFRGPTKSKHYIHNKFPVSVEIVVCGCVCGVNLKGRDVSKYLAAKWSRGLCWGPRNHERERAIDPKGDLLLLDVGS